MGWNGSATGICTCYDSNELTHCGAFGMNCFDSLFCHNFLWFISQRHSSFIHIPSMVRLEIVLLNNSAKRKKKLLYPLLCNCRLSVWSRCFRRPKRKATKPVFNRLHHISDGFSFLRGRLLDLAIAMAARKKLYLLYPIPKGSFSLAFTIKSYHH